MPDCSRQVEVKRPESRFYRWNFGACVIRLSGHVECKLTEL